MEHEQHSDEKFEKFIWKVQNFSRLKTRVVFSKRFVLGGLTWRIGLFPRGDEVDDSLAMYLDAVDTDKMSVGWSRDVKFKLVVFNQLNTNRTITEDFECEFNTNGNGWGIDAFMKLDRLKDPNNGFIVEDNGFIVEDALIVGAEVYVCKSTNEKQLNQAGNFSASLTSGSQASHMEEEEEDDVPRQNHGFQDPNLKTFSPVCIQSTKLTDAEMFSPSTKELMDFSRVGKIEELCSDDSSLVECPLKRSCNFTDSAFAALGRLLYFLKIRKVKDMNDQACKDLQVLWDELQKFKFDLTWVEPHVQYALGTKSYVGKVLQLEKLKENVAALELETVSLKARLVAEEVNVDIEKDLLKAKSF